MQMTENTRFTIRDASPSDARFVAWTVLTAIGRTAEGDEMERLAKSCSLPDTLYSYRNSRLAMDGDKPVACLIAYPGQRYREMRDRTWKEVWKDEGFNLDEIADETAAGEYYLDSMAALPEYRGCGIAPLLFSDAFDRARKLGLETVSLIADLESPRLLNHYRKIGFEDKEKGLFFGEEYRRMTINIK